MSHRRLLTDSLPKRAFAYGLLLFIGGPLPAWIGLWQLRSVAEPRPADGIAALIVAGNTLPDNAVGHFVP